MIDEKFVIVGAFISLIGVTSYISATLNGRTKPNRVTWLLWALAPLIAFSASIKEGAGIIALITFTAGFGPLLIFISSFVNKKAYWKISRFDVICGIISFLALLLWILTGEGYVAILLSIIADLVAGIPTLLKAYKFPKTEAYAVFLLSSISAFITILAIDQWEFIYYGFPLYLLAINLTLFALIKFPLIRWKTVTPPL